MGHKALALLVALLSVALALVLWLVQTRQEQRLHYGQAREYALAATSMLQADLDALSLLLGSLASQHGAARDTLVAALARHPVAAIYQLPHGAPAPVGLFGGDSLAAFADALAEARRAGLPAWALQRAPDGRPILTLVVLTPSGDAAGLSLRAQDWLTRRTGSYQGWVQLRLLDEDWPGSDPQRSWAPILQDVSPALRLHISAVPPEAPSGWLYMQCALVLALGLSMAFVLHRAGTQRLSAEQAVNVAGHARDASEQRLQRALELSRDGVWELEPASGRLYLSPLARRLLGAPAEAELSPMAALRYVPRAWRHEVIERLRAAGISGKAQELRFRQGDGPAARWLRLRVRVFEDAGVRLLTGSLADISDEMQQAGLHEQYRAMLMRVIDALPVPLALHAADQTLLMMNEQYATRLLLPLQVVASTPEYRELAASIEELGVRAVTTGEAQSLEAWLPMLDGDQRYLRISRALCDGMDGEPNIVATFEDITEPTRAAQRIRAERSFFQSIVDNLPHPTFVKDVQHRYTLTNQAHANENNTRTGNILGKRSSDFTPEAAEAIEAAEDALLASPIGSSTEQEMQLIRQGRTHHVVLRKVHIEDGQGQHALLGITTDVTALRETEARLREQTEHHAHLLDFLQSVFDAVPHPLYVKDSQHRYLMSNRAHAESVGAASVADVVGKRSADFVDAAVASVIEADEDALFSRDRHEMLSGEYVLAHRNGNTSNVILCKARCVNADGQTVLVGVNTDITQLREVEAGLRRHRDQLAGLVHAQTRDLVRANEIAEQARDARASFVGRTSSALRAPLNDILIATRDADPAQPSLTLDHIRQRCAAMLDQIGELARNASASKLDSPLVLRTALLPLLIGDVMAEFQPGLTARGMQCTLQQDDPTPPVGADKALLCRALRSIVEHAVTHAGEGSVLNVRVETQASGSMQAVALRLGFQATDPDSAAIFSHSEIHRIVATHGGSLTLDRLPEDGPASLQFTLRLPASPQSTPAPYPDLQNTEHS